MEGPGEGRATGGPPGGFSSSRASLLLLWASPGQGVGLDRKDTSCTQSCARA